MIKFRILKFETKICRKNQIEVLQKEIYIQRVVRCSTCVCVRGMCISRRSRTPRCTQEGVHEKSGVRVCVEVSWRWSRGTAPAGVAVRSAARARGVVSVVEAGRYIYSIIRARCRPFT